MTFFCLISISQALIDYSTVLLSSEDLDIKVSNVVHDCVHSLYKQIGMDKSAYVA